MAVFLIPSDAMREVMNMQFNTALLMGLGVLALLCVTVFMNKRKALVYDTDAFYLFAGPYTRKQINCFILVQTWFQSAIYGLICSYITAMMSFGSGFTVSMMLFSFVVYWLIMAFFLTLTDYIYLWSLVKKKHEILELCGCAACGLLAAAVFFLSVQRTGYDLKNGYMDFALSREFYMVPFFGWGKWAINAFSQGNYLSMLWGILLLGGCNLVLGILFLHFQKDIVEQAVEDAQSVSDYMRKVRANKGNSIMDTKKVKRIKGEFPEGAKAIFYKNMLMMRKTGNFLRRQDIFVIVLYFVISYVCMPGHRFYMFCYMMMIWMFGLMNDAELFGRFEKLSDLSDSGKAFEKAGLCRDSGLSENRNHSGNCHCVCRSFKPYAGSGYCAVCTHAFGLYHDFSGRNSAVCEAFEEPHQCDDGKSSADADYFSVRHSFRSVGRSLLFYFQRFEYDCNGGFHYYPGAEFCGIWFDYYCLPGYDEWKTDVGG